MERFFEGLPFEKVFIEGKECYKSPDGRFFRIDEGKTFIAIECAGDEKEVRLNWFEDYDMFDKDSVDTDMLDVIRSVLREIAA